MRINFVTNKLVRRDPRQGTTQHFSSTIPRQKANAEQYPMENRRTVATLGDKFHGGWYRGRSSGHINVIRGSGAAF